MSPIDWDGFKEVINKNQKFVLISHIRPDCDALGSELGMAGVLEALGKEVRIVNGQSTPSNLDFIDPTNRIMAINEDVTAADLEDTDVAMILDTSAWAQLGPMGDWLKETKCQKIILDHHKSEDDLGATAFKDVQAEATGCLVVQAANVLGVALTKEIATPVFAAIATDTGWFRFGSVKKSTYEVAGRLCEAGASPSEIYGELYERDTVGRLKLRGMVLARTVAECDGRLVHTYIRAEDFAETGAHPSDTEDLINLTLGIAGTEFAVIFVEQLTGGYKLSFRSRCHLDCSKMAENFNGGGHKAAAGAFIEGDFEEVREQVLSRVRSEL